MPNNALKEVNILLVDDNRTDYLMTSRVFAGLPKDKKIELEWASSYEDALEKIKLNQHDMYVIDYRLGVKTGLDLVEECRSRKLTQKPFILLTDHEETDMLEKSVQLGIYDHIRKRDLSSQILCRTLNYAYIRTKVEHELKTEKEFTSFILSEIPYMVLSVDGNGRISSMNPAVSEVLGRSKDNILNSSWKSILHPDEKEDPQYQINNNGDVFFESKILDKNKKERKIKWNVLNKNALNHEGTGNSAFILFGHDLTDQIAAEENEVRRQKMEALGQLAGGVAHEINNLLQPILMSTQLVKGRIESDKAHLDLEYFIKNMDRIARNAQSAAKIVDDILLFSRGDEKETEQLNVHDILNDSVSFVREMLPPTVVVQYEAEPGVEVQQAKMNRNEMLQIVTNLMINAGHAMEQKGNINVFLSSRYLQADDAYKMKIMPGRYVKVDVSDTGSGISEENISQIFNPFFTTKDVGEGTGLGLSIVYKIIERWNGTIKVKSILGKGTTFSLYIPAAS